MCNCKKDYMFCFRFFFVGRILMALTAKFFITVSLNAIYVYSAELFPTVVRYRATYDL